MKVKTLAKNKCVRAVFEFVAEEVAGAASEKLWDLILGAKEAAPVTAPKPASTVSHHIKHASWWAALVGVIVGVLLIAAATAAALALVKLAVVSLAVAGVAGTLGWGATLGVSLGTSLALGGLFTRAGDWVTDKINGMFPAADGPILEGSPNVLINGLPAGRAGLDPVGCTKHGPPQLVAEGSETVFINNAPAARVDVRVTCGAPLKQGSKSVLLGGGTTSVMKVQSEFSWWETGLLYAVEYLMPPGRGFFKGLKNLPKALKNVSWAALSKKLGKALSSAFSKGTAMARAAANAIKGGPRAMKEALKGILVGVCGTHEDDSRAMSGDSDGTEPSDPLSQAGCPIDTSTGAVVEARIDFSVGGSFPFRLTRSYGSQRTTSGLFGHGWRDSLSEHLEITFDGDRVTFHAADGSIVPFDLASDLSRVFNRKYSHFTLTREARGFAVHDRRDDTTRHFEVEGDRGCLTGMHDRHGNGVVLGYLGGRLSWVRHSDGSTLAIRFERDVKEDLEFVFIERMDLGAPVLVARYASRHSLLIDSYVVAGHHLSYEYDRHGRMSRWTDNHKTWVRYEYDDAGRCVRSRAAEGLYSVDLSYDERTRTTLVRNGRGNVTEYGFDENRKLVRKVDPLGNEEVYKYDRHGQRTACVDPLGNVKQDVYDPVSGVLVRRYDREGNVTELFYDHDLRVVAVVDALGRPWTYERGPVGEVTRVEAPDGSVFDYRYTERGLLAEVKRSDGTRRRFTYDGRNRLVAETDWAGNEYRYEYDPRDRLVAATDPGGHRESLFYDPRDLLVMIQHGDRSEVRFEHDKERLLTAVRDENGHVSRREYGAFDLQRSAMDAEGRKYELTYDPDNLEVVSLKAPDGRRYRLERDAAGRVERSIDYGGRVTEYQRDAVGNVVERMNAAGERTSYAYDKNGRLIEIEGDGETTTYEHDALGRLILAESPSARLEWEYDAIGRVTRSVQNGEVLEYQYDATGRCIERVLKPGPWQLVAHHTKYGHDENGRLRWLELSGERLEFERDTRGNAVCVNARAGHRLEQGYDERGYLTEQRLVTGANGGAGLETLHRRYAYDLARNLVLVEDSHWGATRYRHDRSDRIVEAVRSDGLDEAFSYDANGLVAQQRLRTIEEDRIAGIVRSERGLPCRLGDDEYDFDEVGRLVSKTVHRRGFRPRTWTFRWNHQDQLVETRTPEGELWRYAYDPLGRRVLKYNPSTRESVHFLWDGDVLLRELHLVSKTPGGMEQVARVVHWHHERGGFRPLARESEGGMQLVVSDGIGTPVAVVAASGEIAWRGQRGVWGNELRKGRTAGDESIVGFAGQYRDEETGLFYSRFRYYDPGLGAYIGPDPLGLSGGPQPWAYVSNPNSGIDPLGLTGTQKCGDVTTKAPVTSEGKADRDQFELLKADLAQQELLGADPVGSALKGTDPYHVAPTFVKDTVSTGKHFTIQGGDGTHRNLTQVLGAVNDKPGVFEFIVGPEGLTHQRFIEGGTITGFPNQQVPK